MADFYENHARRNFKTSGRLFLDLDDQETDKIQQTSVTGMIYEVGDNSQSEVHPTVQLYTKEGCSLCDKAKDVLVLLREEEPHSLEAIDITDPDKTELFDKYKWDIPVLHIDGSYWTKHRLTAEEALEALKEARAGDFAPRRGEPDAGAMEKKMAARKANNS
eukprot:CAMPEP_0203651280 /NCGR_PEP_ID=MMETSP0088-20131115/26989_1 /ASSEMBLY_ACC=CAM_ASM_001087 /TAXON_ID=426623 /ORGANISM="Chaetoceros affinis, Strain CCMP159" /LENGTH=161 /DNA_ID=CAMNT_0050510367 /DNA_START=58 /DNA_END=544 /DNA_ORIENTATION=+